MNAEFIIGYQDGDGIPGERPVIQVHTRYFMENAPSPMDAYNVSGESTPVPGRGVSGESTN